MKIPFLPGRGEILLFAVLAVLCGAVVASTESMDTGLALAAFPLFVVAGMMGLFRACRVREADE